MKQGDRLSCKTFDVASETFKISPLPIQEGSIQEQISNYSQCEIVDFEDDVPIFSKPFETRRKDGHKVQLIEFNGDLMWQIFEENVQKGLNTACLVELQK